MVSPVIAWLPAPLLKGIFLAASPTHLVVQSRAPVASLAHFTSDCRLRPWDAGILTGVGVVHELAGVLVFRPQYVHGSPTLKVPAP